VVQSTTATFLPQLTVIFLKSSKLEKATFEQVNKERLKFLLVTQTGFKLPHATLLLLQMTSEVWWKI
jgi:hypothetical protein